jgi:hypothetical protein
MLGKINPGKLSQDATMALQNLQNLYTQYKGEIAPKIDVEKNVDLQPYSQTMTNAQNVASQAKFQREDMLQDIQRQRQQQSLQKGNNYLEGLR